MMRTRTAALSVVAGLALAGGLVAGGAAGDGGSSAAHVRPEPAAADLRVDGRALHGATARTAERGAVDPAGLHLALLKTRADRATVRIAQAGTPVDGRLPWAVRTFDRPRVTGGNAALVRIDRTRPGIRCAQVGRVRGRSFGWVRPAGDVFRRLGAETDLAAVCATDAGGDGIASHALLLPDRDPDDPAARIRGAVVWGLAPASVPRVRVTWAGWTRTVPVRGGTFLVIGPPPSSPVVDRDARVVDARSAPRSAPAPSRRAPQAFTPATAEHPRIAARLVDPATGRPSVVVTGTVHGRPCDGGVSTFAAGVAGGVDPELLTVSGAGRDCQVIPRLRAGAPPMLTGYGGGIGGPSQGGPDLVGRERLVPGGFQVTVLTPPDVVRVELRSSGDVRTVRPVAPGIVHALYDGSANARGDFTGPGVDVVGIRADGSRVRAAGVGVPRGIALGDAELGGR